MKIYNEINKFSYTIFFFFFKSKYNKLQKEEKHNARSLKFSRGSNTSINSILKPITPTWIPLTLLHISVSLLQSHLIFYSPTLLSSNLTHYSTKPVQSVIWVSSAAPLSTQYASGWRDGNMTVTTKFVLCPVVLKVPARTDVLYNGQA